GPDGPVVLVEPVGVGQPRGVLVRVGGDRGQKCVFVGHEGILHVQRRKWRVRRSRRCGQTIRYFAGTGPTPRVLSHVATPLGLPSLEMSIARNVWFGSASDRASLPVFMSQNFRFPSPFSGVPPVTSVSLSRNLTIRMLPVLYALNTSFRLPLPASNTQAPSAPPIAISLPSGLKAAEYHCSCGLSTVLRCLPVAASQTRTVMSSLGLASFLPSAEKASRRTAFLWS